MKKNMILIALLTAGMSLSAFSQTGTDAASGTVTDSTAGKRSVRPGKEIRRINRNGYTLTYYLLD